MTAIAITRSIATVFLVGTSLLQAGDSQSRRASDGEQSAVISVIPVTYADAHEILAVFRPLGLNANVAVDSISNAIVIRGDRDVIDAATELVRTLDKPREAPSAGEPVIIKIGHRDVNEIIHLIHDTFDFAETNIGVDQTNNLLIVSGSQSKINPLRKFVELVDTPRAPLRLTFFFIKGAINRTGVDEGRSDSTLPSHLKAVQTALEQTGFTNMELSAPITTNAMEESSFGANGYLAGGHSDGGVEYIVKGHVHPSPQASRAKIEIRGMVRLIQKTLEGHSETTLFHAETSLVTRLGDYVVVAAAPSSTSNNEALALVVRVDAVENSR